MKLHNGTITFEYEAERDLADNLVVTGIWFPVDLNPQDLIFKGVTTWLNYYNMEEFILANLHNIYVSENESLFNIIDNETPHNYEK